ncbi:transglycosylase SLT domain-containing protein [Campylobacter geochelonis]|uniref:Conjugal transfer protein n=1 Tax=Campylobacter geochelonis TaxID=1780362 RepID=A0A128EGZ6_9BACT|nr:transglycosylase SLT domain-containing protein [Campylobacter geochelonis]QKF71794.1 putative lytic transglycosylase [Campylobacter geochelonis]CZE47503.1 conjugal transfer protein [Campylobacter geochelonis]
MKFRAIFLFIFVFKLSSFAYSYEEILYTIADVAKTQGVSPKILYTIVKIESNFEPFAISFLTNKENALYFKKLETQNIRIKISNYSLNRTKWVVSIKPKNQEYAKEIAKILVENGFNIDVGLGQLNSQNFKKDEFEYVFEPSYNLTKCAQVLRKCFNAKDKNMQKTIECYNYGMRNRGSNPYYKRFYEHYIKEFGSGS